jgi:putative intracellular protease/amidase/YHS domain-containing protein
MKRRDLIQFSIAVAAGTVAPMVRASDAAGAMESAAAPVPDGHLTSPLAAPAGRDIRVAFLISEGAEVVDFSGPWGVFEYTLLGDDNHNPFQLYTVSASKQPVKVSGGLTVTPDYTFADAPTPDVIVVPALDDEQLAPGALEWLKAASPKTQLTMSVCNGSYVLAAAGLLDGRRATAHHGGYGMMYALYPKVVLLRGLRYVEDGKFATSGGLTSGVDLALRVVERYYGRDVAQRTARQLEYHGTGWMHPASNGQFARVPVGTEERPICPVCEAQLVRAKALTWVYHEKTWYFCGTWCRDTFMTTPERFISKFS